LRLSGIHKKTATENHNSMARSPSFAGVILAAGESSRMGRDKALLPWPPQTAGPVPEQGCFLSAAIRSLALSTDFVVVVAGANQSALSPVVYASGASMAVNPEPERGQFSSLQVGLHEVLNRGRDAAIITLIDRPPVTASTIQMLSSAFEEAASEVWAIVPEYSGRHGHPFVAGRELIKAFLREPATRNARAVERQHQTHILYLAVDDPYVALNVNTPEDYAALAPTSKCITTSAEPR
jgi:molybdenum cofactor cytidylyltransferase